MSNRSLPWAAYNEFIYGRLIVLDKHPGVRPVGVGETWRRIISKIILKVTGPESTKACQDDQLCDGIKVGIDGTIHRVQYLWGKNLFTEEWVFLLVDAKNVFNEINQVRMLWTVQHVWPSGARFVFNCYRHLSSLFCGTGMGRQVFCIVEMA